MESGLFVYRERKKKTNVRRRILSGEGTKSDGGYCEPGENRTSGLNLLQT